MKTPVKIPTVCHIREMEFHKLKLWVTAGLIASVLVALWTEWTLVAQLLGLGTNMIWLFGKEL